MDSKKELELQVFSAARDQGISSVLFRNAMSRKLGLSATDSECLSFVSLKGTAAPTEIARYTGLTTGSTTAMLDRLEKIGYVQRMPNPNDRRGVLVKTTDAWTAASQPLVVDMQRAHKELLAGYTAVELEIIADFLVRFTKNVQNQTRVIETTAS